MPRKSSYSYAIKCSETPFWLAVKWAWKSGKQNGDIQVRQSYQLIFFMIQTNLCERFHCSLWITKWTITRNHSLIHRPRILYKPTHFWILKDWPWQSNVLYGYNWTSSCHSKLFPFWTKSKMASVAKGKLGNRLNDDVILLNCYVILT